MNKINTVLRDIFKSRLKTTVFIIALLALIFAIYKIAVPSKSKSTVQTQKVERGTIISSISASGQVLTANIVNITSSAKGLVKNVYVKDDDKVSAGQKIMEITLDSDAQQKAASAYSSYLSAKNSLDSSQLALYSLDSAMWAANRKLINDAVSRGLTVDDPTYIQEHDDWLSAEGKYINQQAVITQAQRSVNNAWLAYQAVSPTVTVPMSGVITNFTYSEGMTIGGTTDAGQRIAVIKSEGPPLATFNLSEIDVSKVKPGQKATIKLDSLTEKTFTGKLVNVDKIGTVSNNVTAYPVVIKFDTGSPEVLPNMSATANIVLETKIDVLQIPSTAIRAQGEQKTVQVLKNKKEQTLTVETGLISDSQTEIISGLSEGDEVVVSATTSNGSNATGRSVFSGQGVGRMFMGR